MIRILPAWLDEHVRQWVVGCDHLCRSVVLVGVLAGLVEGGVIILRMVKKIKQKNGLIIELIIIMTYEQLSYNYFLALYPQIKKYK